VDLKSKILLVLIFIGLGLSIFSVYQRSFITEDFLIFSEEENE